MEVCQHYSNGIFNQNKTPFPLPVESRQYNIVGNLKYVTCFHGDCKTPKQNRVMCLACHKNYCNSGHYENHCTTTKHLLGWDIDKKKICCSSCNTHYTATDDHYKQLELAASGTVPPSVVPNIKSQPTETLNWEIIDFKKNSVFGIVPGSIVDKVMGCIYGTALGDAFGIATEFLLKKEVISQYGNHLIPFRNFFYNWHNLRFDPGDWTDDTDQMILILETLLEKQSVDEKLFAHKLLDWSITGFPELGDTIAGGIGNTVSKVVQHPSFLDNPHHASEYVWINHQNRNGAANGAVMRTTLLGCLNHTDLKKVLENTEKICKVTHFDPRCVVSCSVVTVAIALILQGAILKTLGDVEKLIEISREKAIQQEGLNIDLNELEYHLNISPTSLDTLLLDDPQLFGYTYKTMGAAFWALRHYVAVSGCDFVETMQTLVREGGDADTNGAVAGGLLGVVCGYTGLPKEWLAALPRKNKLWLDWKCIEFARKYLEH